VKSLLDLDRVGDRRHDDSDGRHDDSGAARRQQEAAGRRADGRHDAHNGRHDDGKGQHGDRRHDDGDGRHDDGDWGYICRLRRILRPLEETRSELFWGETGLKIRQTCFVTTIVNS
jgi:hypothetical protein